MEAAEKQKIGKFFAFLKDKEDRDIPLKAQFTFSPESIDWNELGYDVNDLDLIKQTDNIENIVWDKVDQSDFAVLKWVINNTPKKIDPSKIDINTRGIAGMLAKANPDIIDWSKFIIDDFMKAKTAARYGGDEINWDNIDYSNRGAVLGLHKIKPEVIDKSKIDPNAEWASKILGGSDS